MDGSVTESDAKKLQSIVYNSYQQVMFYNASAANVSVGGASNSAIVGLAVNDNKNIMPNTDLNIQTWSTTDKNVAKITENGTIKAVGQGIAIVSAKTEDNKVASYIVKVENKKISLDKTSFSMTSGGATENIIANVSSDVLSKKVFWYSSNPNVVTVNDNGTVVSRESGIAVITAKLESGEKATCNIKVNPRDTAYFAHRGVSDVVPENSIVAFRAAGKSTASYGIETDIRMTSDGELVCMNENTVDKTTNGSGKVSDMTLEQIRSLKIDYGNNIDKFSNLTVPTIEEYLDICQKYSCYSVINLKNDNGTIDYNTITKTLDVLEEKNMLNKCYIISTNFDAIKVIQDLKKQKNVYSKVKTGYIVNETSKEVIDEIGKIDGNMIVSSKISQDMINYAHSKKIQVDLSTVDDANLKAKASKMGIDYVTTNRP